MTHDPMCPCNNADERGCFLISAETAKCVSCVCGDKMDTYLDGYERGLRDAVEAVTRTCAHTKYEGYLPCQHDDAITAIDALRNET